MSKKILANVGDIFNDYVVVDNSIEKTVDGKIMYHVQCKCGKIEYVRGYFLRIGRQKCCKSCSSKTNYLLAVVNNSKFGFIKYKHEGCGDITKTVYSYIKRNAKRRNIYWDDNITIEYLWNLYLVQDKKCALSGELIFFTDKRVKSNIDFNLMTASLDRIDSKIGYVKNNIQWVHKDVNLMKNDLNQKYFIGMCNKICEKNKLFSSI